FRIGFTEALIPSFRQAERRAEFNEILGRLGGKEMDEEGSVDREHYIESLTPAETHAYYRALTYWDAHSGSPTAIHDFLDDQERVAEGLHHSHYQPRTQAGLFDGPPEFPAPSRTTGISHAVIEAEREMRGLPAFQKARRSHGQSFDEGVAAV